MTLQVSKNQFALVSDNGKKINIVPSFEKDKVVLDFLDGVEITQVIKRQSKQTFKSNKDGKDKHYYNFYIITSSKKSIQIKVANTDDIRVLDAISDYIK